MDEQSTSAFGFEGNWKEYAPIAFTNLLLTIVTLGIYRFWATTRTRKYLWSHSRFIDDRLEWTGTGKELFIGFLMVLLILGLPFFILQFGAQALVMRGMGGIAALLGFSSVLVIFYFVGIARFRALRYRLSRTYWHGIRGGSDDAGWRYGWSYMWKTIVGMIPIYLLVPRAMMSLWNQRWNSMSFGPHGFESNGDYRPAFKRYLLFYLLPFIVLAGGLVFALFAGVGSVMAGGGAGGSAIGALIAIAFGLGIYGLFLFVGISFYAIFIREAVGGLSLSTLTFAFGAHTMDWIKLFLGDIALVIGTLGIGSIFLQYRHWKFFITHLEAYGDIDLDALTQSDTKLAKHGEGLLDALDVGAI